MRKIAATYVFPISSSPLKNAILILDDNGVVLDLIDTKGQLSEQSGLEYYNGILVPGFVNAHCHLEFSFLQKKIETHTGLGSFLGKINQLRKVGESDVLLAAEKADKEMFRNGIVAVGDVSNNALTVQIKKESKLVYYTFVEVFGFLEERANRAFSIAKDVLGEFELNNLQVSMVPHSPYSVSEKLFGLIKLDARKNKGIISMHNQEDEAENSFFKYGEGGITNHFSNNLGLDISGWKPTGKNSLPSVFKKLPQNNQLLLVHNTFTSKDDISFVNANSKSRKVFFVLCPNANLYINNKISPVDLFLNENVNICLGTDSFASNSELSILSEMKAIQKFFPDTGLNDLLKWATLNGARALRMDKRFGTFEIGKQPGINLISKADLIKLKLTSDSKVKRIA